MPQVTLTVSRCGTAPDGKPFSQNAGETITVGEDEAARMIAAGQAVPVPAKAPVETRAPAPPAEPPKPKPKRKRKAAADALDTQDNADG